jgi:hypothetical protein
MRILFLRRTAGVSAEEPLRIDTAEAAEILLFELA